MRLDFSPEAKRELRNWAQGKRGHHRRTCPDCSPNRFNKNAQCLSVTVHAEHMVMNCHHCERAGATKLQVDEIQRPYTPPPAPPKPKGKAVKRLDVGLTEAAIDFLTSRHISLKTAQATSLVAGRAYFPDLRGEDEAIAFPYFVNDKPKSHKFRALSDKAHVCDEALSSLFMIQLVDLSDSDDMLICEGELDSLSFYEAAVVNSTSVPNGASSFSRQNEDGSPREVMGFLWDAKSLIDQARRILIATDDDEPGDKLAEELARRIGRHRCWRIKYPEGCKDANDVLVKFGKDAVKHLTETAEPWPIDGLYEAQKYFPEVLELFENGFGEKVSTGLSAVDEIFSVGPGLLTVVTGVPGNGKSTWVDQIMINLARSRGYVSAICSFENPPAVHIGKLAQCLVQKHFFQTDIPGEMMSRKDVDAVLPFIHRHFKFLQQEDGKKSTIDSIIERIKTAVFRWGVQIVVVDPYNYIARPPKVDSETQFIDDILSELRLTAQLYGLHIFFVAHPTKLPKDSEGNYSPPKGYDISGSAAWFSKPDFGITVHRVPHSNDVKIINWKTRFDWLGKVGEQTVMYDNMRHVYCSDNWTDNLAYDGDDQ